MDVEDFASEVAKAPEVLSAFTIWKDVKMTTHVLAALIGPLEMIFFVILLASPFILIISHFFFMARFNRNKLDLGMTEAKLLSDLAQLGAESASGRNEDVSTSTRREGGGLSYALQSE